MVICWFVYSPEVTSLIFLVGVCGLSLRNLTHFYNHEKMILGPIVTFAKFSTQIYIFKPENHNFKTHIYYFCYDTTRYV